MIDVSLLEYIKRQLSRGSSVQEITSFLIKRGYSIDSINECLRQLYQNKSPVTEKKKSHIPIFLIILIILIIIGLLSYFMFFKLELSNETDLEMIVYLESTSINAESNLIFQRMLNNKGALPNLPVRVVYIIEDSSGNRVHMSDENMVITDSLSHQRSIQLSSMVEGNYNLKIDAYYSGKTLSQSLPFVIVKTSTLEYPATCFDGIQNQGEEGIDCGGPCKPCIRQCPLFYDDGNKCTISKCGAETNFIPVHEDIVPCCGNNICEIGENPINCPGDCKEGSQDTYFNDTIRPQISFVNQELPIEEEIKRIRQLSAQDKFSSMELCDAILLPFYKDSCFYEVAQELEDKEICNVIIEERTKDKCFTKISDINSDSGVCGYISSDLRRDSCYMKFVLQGDYSVCSMIKDQYYVQTCNQLKSISQTSPEVIAEYAN
jgi:hypothetical protein